MKWIPCSEYMPAIPESVEVTDGFTVMEAFIWDRSGDGVYFDCMEEAFSPIWWRPLPDSAIEKDFKRNTRIPNDPNQTSFRGKCHVV